MRAFSSTVVIFITLISLQQISYSVQELDSYTDDYIPVIDLIRPYEKHDQKSFVHTITPVQENKPLSSAQYSPESNVSDYISLCLLCLSLVAVFRSLSSVCEGHLVPAVEVRS